MKEFGSREDTCDQVFGCCVGSRAFLVSVAGLNTSSACRALGKLVLSGARVGI